MTNNMVATAENRAHAHPLHSTCKPSCYSTEEPFTGQESEQNVIPPGRQNHHIMIDHTTRNPHSYQGFCSVHYSAPKVVFPALTYCTWLGDRALHPSFLRETLSSLRSLDSAPASPHFSAHPLCHPMPPWMLSSGPLRTSPLLCTTLRCPSARSSGRSSPQPLDSPLQHSVTGIWGEHLSPSRS